MITPGVERFEYFRHLERIAYGKQPPESLLEVQELYDTYFQSSAPWDRARALSDTSAVGTGRKALISRMGLCYSGSCPQA